MKVTIYDQLAGGRVPSVVPPAYRDDMAALARPDGHYSVLLFAHTPRDVVPSAPVRRALRRLVRRAPDGAFAVGTVFTDEALALLAEHDIRPVVLRKARWTDATARGRQL